MGRSSFLSVVLVSLLLVSCFSHGYGRKLIEVIDNNDSTSQLEESAGNFGQVIEAMDYPDPEANTNPSAGYIISPPPLP